ncbi:hypothetical protein [Paracoccus thiocyanatus]|nr:hypothetical protein [Paracoccus thiocyanatus]
MTLGFPGPEAWSVRWRFRCRREAGKEKPDPKARQSDTTTNLQNLTD